jgi:hypothetical protein
MPLNESSALGANLMDNYAKILTELHELGKQADSWQAPSERLAAWVFWYFLFDRIK